MVSRCDGEFCAGAAMITSTASIGCITPRRDQEWHVIMRVLGRHAKAHRDHIQKRRVGQQDAGLRIVFANIKDLPYPQTK